MTIETADKPQHQEDFATEDRQRLSEIEVFRLLGEARQQYEEYMRIADPHDVSGIPDIEDDFRPRYAWDNPIGLTINKSG